MVLLLAGLVVAEMSAGGRVARRRLNVCASANASEVAAARDALVNSALQCADPSMAPPSLSRGVLSVHINLELDKLLDINEVAGTVSVLSAITSYWSTERFAWDPSLYSGIDSVFLPRDAVWLPGIYLYNTGRAPWEAEADKTFKVEVMHDGYVVDYLPVTLTYTCSFDHTLFPFDTQECWLELDGKDYDYTQMELVAAHNGTQYSWAPGPTVVWRGFDSAGWKLLRVVFKMPSPNYYDACECEESSLSCGGRCDPAPQARWTLVLERQSSWYIMNGILPISIVTVAGFSTHWMPCSEEASRCAIAMTVMLTIGALQIVVTQGVPHGASATWMDKFSIVSLAYAALTLLISVFVGYLRRWEVSTPKEGATKRETCLKAFRFRSTAPAQEPPSIEMLAGGDVEPNAEEPRAELVQSPAASKWWSISRAKLVDRVFRVFSPTSYLLFMFVNYLTVSSLQYDVPDGDRTHVYDPEESAFSRHIYGSYSYSYDG